ncbi:MAG TPA: PAS domain-containing protein, partial [Flavisolibacter sp.]|nr:PAS domain-containing protein [Flavisolibacter sp.]
MKKLALRLAMKLNSAKTEDRPKDVNPVSYPVPIDEGSLQNIVEFMAEDFAVSIAAICLVGKEEASVIAGVGVLKNTSLEKSESFCAWAMQADDIVVINNAGEEPLLRQHPFVKGEQKIVFVAAVPLTTQNGSRIGAVCIADKKERNLSDRERSRLLRFARIVNHDLELILSLQKKIEGLEEREFQLKQASKLAKIGRWEYDVESKKATWSDELFEIYGVDKAECKTNLLSVYLSLVHPDDYTRVRRKIVNAQKAPELSQERLIRPDGKVVYINQFRQNIYDDDGNLVKVIGISQDVTEEVLNSERIKKNEERFSALVQNISDMIAILDPTGTINYVSP